MQKSLLELKTCTACKKKKPKTTDYFYHKTKTSFRSECSECTRARVLNYRKKHRDQLAQNQRKYYAAHADEQRARATARRSRYSTEQKKRWHAARYKKIQNTPRLRILHSLRARLYFAVKRRKSAATLALLGAPVDVVLSFLESKFLPGMTWSNYGGRQGWHIDHKVPCCAFDLTKESEQKACFHYTNLQPLWARDNRSKIATDLLQRKPL